MIMGHIWLFYTLICKSCSLSPFEGIDKEHVNNPLDEIRLFDLQVFGPLKHCCEDKKIIVR